MKDLREEAQQFALGMWLADYPYDMSYEDILDQLHSGEYEEGEDIMLWEVVEDLDGRTVAEIIDDTRSSFEQRVARIIANLPAKEG